MPVEMKKVFSSHIDEIGFDADTGDLLVKYSSGKTSAYTGVAEKTANEVMNAPSVGEALHQSIKGQYAHKYL